MSKYLNDPREMAIRPESGVTLEEDNRYETMYHWGAKVLDLCELPVDEYMKPMTVITNGGGGGGGSDTGDTPTPTKRNISMKVDVISPNGDVIGADGSVIGNVEGDGTWKVRWTWDKDYNVVLASSVKVYDENNQEYVVDALIPDNNNNEYEAKITNIGNNTVSRIGSYGVGNSPSDTSNTSVSIVDTSSNVEYVVNIKPNSEQTVVEYNIYYGAKSKSESIANNELNIVSLYDANSENGVNIEFSIPVSSIYEAESELFDDGESPYDGDDAQERWDAWAEQYESQNRYNFRIYIPSEIENNYTYQLYNDNAGQLTDASLVKTGTSRTIEGAEYSEYINEDVNYAYDDKPRSFKLKFIINDK